MFNFSRVNIFRRSLLLAIFNPTIIMREMARFNKFLHSSELLSRLANR